MHVCWAGHESCLHCHHLDNTICRVYKFAWKHVTIRWSQVCVETLLHWMSSVYSPRHRPHPTKKITFEGWLEAWHNVHIPIMLRSRWRFDTSMAVNPNSTLGTQAAREDSLSAATKAFGWCWLQFAQNRIMKEVPGSHGMHLRHGGMLSYKILHSPAHPPLGNQARKPSKEIR